VSASKVVNCSRHLEFEA